MALAATTIFEVQTGGSDTLNGGAFDPGQTAGMFTDGAATVATGNSPVFTSASYNFIAGDVGAWIFIGAGTNWTKGWYKIASVAANAATLSAAIGAAVQSLNVNAPTLTTAELGPNTVAGAATTASPTGATWSIDYSQQAAAQFAYTDLASVGAGLLVSSVAKPFAKQQVGNALVITGGTNFTTGRYVIASVAAGVATVLGAANITTAAGVSGTGGQGGALATVGQAGAHMVATAMCYVKTGSYTQTSASSNVAGGAYNPAGGTGLEGYGTIRGDLNPVAAAGTRPTITASGISTFTMIGTANVGRVSNFILDGASLTASRGVVGGNATLVTNVHAKNFTNNAIAGTGTAVRCSATGCSTQTAITITCVFGCVAYSNTISGFAVTFASTCVAYANSGGSSAGFTNSTRIFNSVAYGNGGDGINSAAQAGVVINCIASGNTGVGITLTGNPGQLVLNCATFNNTGGAITINSRDVVTGTVTLTADPFTNAASGDFSLNTTAGGGAAVRAAGYPGIFPVGLTTGYLDVGAAQHRDSQLLMSRVFTGM